MKKLLLVVLTAFLLIITGCFAPGDHTPDDHSAKAQEIHQNAWERVTNLAVDDGYYKYGIYASRTMAVKHPEIYLQANRLFIETIQSRSGIREAYFNKDVRDMQFRYGFGGPPFTFDDVNFDDLTEGSFRELYPDPYPVLPFLDRRIFPSASTLKPFQNHSITSIDKTILLYLKENTPENYIIYCDNENAYISGSLESSIKGNPILIFNESYVWYPLMRRDDSAKDSILEDLVKCYVTSITIPALTDFEAGLIPNLKENTVLSSDAERIMAVIAAAHSEHLGGMVWDLRDIYTAYPSYRVYGVVEVLLRNANI